MSQLIRLVYASRSTFEPTARQRGLDPGVARILAKSRKNNARLQVVGGLLFGEGYFLQCLEGEAAVVQALYNRIEADRRHRDVKLLSRSTITSRSFGTWSMKYVPAEQALQSLLQSWGSSRFDPYRLSPQQIETAVLFMQAEADSVDTLPGELDDLAPAQVAARTHPAVTSLPAATAGQRSPNLPPQAPAAQPKKPRAVALGALGLACAAALGYLLLA